MGGQVKFFSIYDLKSYSKPSRVLKGHKFITENEKINENFDEWYYNNEIQDLWFRNPETWWAIRRAQGSQNILFADDNRIVTIPIENLEDQALTDRVWDWLHDDNLIDDVYVLHAMQAESKNKTSRKKKSIFSLKETPKPAEFDYELYAKFIFCNTNDAINFKLSCL